jgi:DNA repair exonuclease SbcCD ATPase subunit
VRIATIILEGWMCFGEKAELRLPAGPIAIVARWADDPGRSNWAGKTALLEAVRWCLLGTHRKRTDDAIITRGCAKASVDVRFDGGSRIMRTRPRGGPTTVMAWPVANEEACMGAAAEAAIERMLRLSGEDFESTTWFGQGDTEALVGQSSGPRREIVARWLDLDVWKRAGKGANAELERARRELDLARASATAIPEATNASEASLQGLESDLAAVRGTVRELSEQLQAWELRQRAAASIQTARQELQQAGQRAQEARKIASEAASAVVVAEEGEKLNAALKRADEVLGVAKQERDRAHRLVLTGFDGTCPVISAACPARSQVETMRGRFMEQAEAAKEKLDAALVRRGEAQRAVADAHQVERSAVAARTRLEEAIAATHSLAERVRKLEEQLAGDAIAAEGDEVSWRQERHAAESRAAELERAIGAARQALRTEQANQKAREAAATRTQAAEVGSRSALLAARALGPAGIPARIAADQLRALEERANALLVGSGLSFTLSWQRELGDPASECAECGREYEKRSRAKDCPGCGAVRGKRMADELDILVDDGSGEVEDARVKSGGARVLVAAAVRLAGGMMLRERRGSPLALAVVDEPFGPLDKRNRTTLARTFASMLGSVGLEQAFVVSHDEALLSALPSRIVIVRDGKRSRAEVV